MAIEGTNRGLTSISERTLLQSIFGPGTANEAFIPNIGSSGAPIQGQNGFINDYHQLDTSTPLVFGQLIPTLIHAPNIFEIYDSITHLTLTRFLKFLVESHASSITGIDIEYTLETVSSPSGQDSQQYIVPSKTSLTQPSPSFTWDELNNNIIFNFIKNWLFLIRHPKTQTSSRNYLLQNEPQITGANLKPLVSSDISMTVLFTQYGAGGFKEDIIDAYLITNMFPTGSSPAGYQRNVSENVKPERNINFTGFLEHSPTILAFAQRIHDEKYQATSGGVVDSDRYDTILNEDRPDYLKSSTANTPA